MAQFFTLHPDNPQPRLIKQTWQQLQQGAVIALPTDSCYVLACALGDKNALARIRQLRGVDDKHHFTLLCRDFAEMATYARVDDACFRLLKRNTPGQYTFILPATKEVPRRLQHPKRSTIGIRLPNHAVVQGLLNEAQAPLVCSTLILPPDIEPLMDAWSIREQLEHQIELILDAGGCGWQPTTVIDLTTDTPSLIRLGGGDPRPFGIEPE